MLNSEDNFHDDDDASDEWSFLELMVRTLSLLSLSVVSRFTVALLLLAEVAGALLLFLLLACREIKGCSSEEAEAEAEASPCWLLPTAAIVCCGCVVVVVE